MTAAPSMASTAPRIRVLHVVQNLNYGGMERLIADLVRHIDRDRFESHVLVLQYAGRFSRDLDGAPLHRAASLPRWSMLWPRALARQIAAIAPDVVHTHSGVWYKASLAARRAGVRRVIHTEHGRHRPDPWRHRLVDGLAAGRTDVVVAVSEPLASELARGVVRRRAPIHVVLNGVDTSRFRPRPDTGAGRRALGFAGDVPVFGSVGRLEPVKGYDVMLEAFALLRARWRGAPAPALVVVGDGAERGRLGVLAQHLGIGEGVRLLGWRDDVDDLHAMFDLFTLASRSEGTSVSLLEAMSAGLCPVVTDVGGNRAVLGQALSHRLVPRDDAEALATAWQTAFEDGGGRRRDAAAARSRAVDRFSLGQMVLTYQGLYQGTGAGQSG